MGVWGRLCTTPVPKIAEEEAQHGFDFVWIDYGAWTESNINEAVASFVDTESATWWV